MTGPSPPGKRFRRLRGVVSAPFRPFLALIRQPHRTLACILSAGLVVLSFPRFDLFPLLFVAYIPLLAVITRVKPSRAFFWGWLTGMITVAFGFYFIQQLLRVFGGLPTWACILLHLLFSAFQGIHVGVFSSLVSWLSRDRRFSMALVAPLTFVAVELFAREIYIFPYHIGNATYLFTPFIQVSDLTGVLGLTAMVLLVNSTLFVVGSVLWERIRHRSAPAWPWRSVLVTAVLFAFCLVYGFIRIGQIEARMAVQPTLRVGLVEADIGIFMKANPQRVADNLLIHQNLSAHVASLGADLIVWPETAVNIPYVAVSTTDSDDIEVLEASVDLVTSVPREVTYFRPSRIDLVEHVQQDRELSTSLMDRGGVQRGFQVPLLFGVLTGRDPTAEELPGVPPQGRRRPRIHYNTAILLDGQGRVLGSYDKNVLLMFGEYVPFSHFLYRTFGFNFFAMVPTAGDVTPGEGVSVIELPYTTADGQSLTIRIGAMICYEDIIADYGLELAELAPNLFVNVINDGWFQTSSAAYHHMAFSVFRAVEHRLPLVRATNTGVSSIIDPTGRILAQTWLVGAATRVEDARYELLLQERLDMELASRLMAVEERLGDLQNTLVQATEILEAARTPRQPGPPGGTGWPRVLSSLSEQVGTVASELTTTASTVRAIAGDLRRAGSLQGEVGFLLESSQDLMAQVIPALARARDYLEQARVAAGRGEQASPWFSSRLEAAGRVIDDSQRKLSGPEYLIEDVPVMPPPSTVYSRIGDGFAWLALLAVAAMSVLALRERWRKPRAEA